jgi:hypothetical protein
MSWKDKSPRLVSGQHSTLTADLAVGVEVLADVRFKAGDDLAQEQPLGVEFPLECGDAFFKAVGALAVFADLRLLEEVPEEAHGLDSDSHTEGRNGHGCQERRSRWGEK